MELGYQEEDLDSYTGQSFDGNVRRFGSGFSQNDLNLSPGRSLDGSFRKSNSVISFYSVAGSLASIKFQPTSRRGFKGLKDFARNLIDPDFFAQEISDWVVNNYNIHSATGEQYFSSPFTSGELRKLDLALEGMLFQQLVRMPCFSEVPTDIKEDQFLALEDFLHAIVIGLWRTFWHKRGPLPLFVSGPRRTGSKFYTVEKAISRGRLGELCGLALVSKDGTDIQVRWDQVVLFALFKSNIFSENESRLSPLTICEALFYGFHILVSRSFSKISTITSESIFVLVLDSKHGGVVKLSGDVSKLNLNSTNPYESAAEWMMTCAEVCVTPMEQIWNKLGNANWMDMGTLQILLATFYSIAQWKGPPRKSVASLISDHSLRLQKRRMECCPDIENGLVPFAETINHDHGEIVELDQNDNPFLANKASRLKLRSGDVLMVEDPQQGRKSFQIHEHIVGGNHFIYSAVSLDHPNFLSTLYVGAHPSRLEPSWEDMSLWYQVQRQTKVLNILRQRGISSKYLPEIVSSGRILHPGHCNKETPSGRCDHPSCGTPILVTSPFGEPLSSVITRDGAFTSKEAIHCCRDCLAALRSAGLAGIQHGDISPDNIVRVIGTQGTRDTSAYVPISWGRAVLEDRDGPAINLQFSSSHALQHGKLCPSSDAESIVYLLYYLCGGTVEQPDSIESSLQWRERSWAQRLLQHYLGQVSPLLKAFADYVDSLCGTPYPVDYDIWLKRFDKALDISSDRGKMIEETSIILRLEDAAESPGTSGGAH